MGLSAPISRLGYQMQELRVVDCDGKRVAGFGTRVFYRTNRRALHHHRPRRPRPLIFERIEDDCECIFGDEHRRITGRRGRCRRQLRARGAATLRSRRRCRRASFARARASSFGPEDRLEKHLGYMVAAVEVPDYRPRDELVYVIYGMPGRQVARFALHDGRTLILVRVRWYAPTPATTSSHRKPF